MLSGSVVNRLSLCVHVFQGALPDILPFACKSADNEMCEKVGDQRIKEGNEEKGGDGRREDINEGGEQRRVEGSTDMSNGLMDQVVTQGENLKVRIILYISMYPFLFTHFAYFSKAECTGWPSNARGC
jgi:hypothetical protein